MRKVIVIGSPGAGKSTFARKLRDVSRLPLYYLDLLWHKEDRTNVTKEEFDQELQEILTKDAWIIDGNYNRTLERRLEECDTVFLLDYPVEVCLEGVRSRIGKEREDMPWTETEFDPEFRQWILDFPRDQLPEIYRLLKQYKDGRKIHVFRSREDVETYLKSFWEEEMRIVPAYDFPEEVGALFQEYTQMLVDQDPAFQQYLEIQNYDEELKHLEEKYGMPEGRLYLAFCGDRAAGCIGLKKIGEGKCEMKRLYVRPEFRGCHIGGRLIRRIIEDAKEIGYQYMFLDTLPFLESAIHMYKKYGFYEIESYNDSPMDTSIYMRLDL